MGGNEHLLQIIIQVMLGLAIFSFLEYSIRTANAPAVVNRRAKLICAAGLSLSVIGMVVLMYHAGSGIAMILTGSAASVLSMVWLEARAKAVGPAGFKATVEDTGNADSPADATADENDGSSAASDLPGEAVDGTVGAETGANSDAAMNDDGVG